MNGKIMLVEDELKTGEILKKALETKEIIAEWFIDGNTALAQFESGKYDLVVLDLKLPGMTGDEILEKIRETDPYVTVVIYTSHEEIPVMTKLLNLGVDRFVKKGPSADLWETVALIEKLISPMTEEEEERVIQTLPKDLFKE